MRDIHGLKIDLEDYPWLLTPCLGTVKTHYGIETGRGVAYCDPSERLGTVKTHYGIETTERNVADDTVTMSRDGENPLRD